MTRALTDAQLALVTQAANLLPLPSREYFFESVARVLSERSPGNPSDNEVARALRFILAGRGVAVGRELLEVTSNKTICCRR
jgi:hypothetical protein